MEIETTKVTKLKLTELSRLDPVHVFLEDIADGTGRITITCYGKAWSAFWGGMGSHTIAGFFCSCDEDYLAKNLSDISSTVTDYDKISKDIGEDTDRDWLAVHADKLAEVYGADWYMDLPQTSNSEYQYLCRIIKAVQSALADKQQTKAA